MWVKSIVNLKNAQIEFTGDPSSNDQDTFQRRSTYDRFSWKILLPIQEKDMTGYTIGNPYTPITRELCTDHTDSLTWKLNKLKFIRFIFIGTIVSTNTIVPRPIIKKDVPIIYDVL